MIALSSVVGTIDEIGITECKGPLPIPIDLADSNVQELIDGPFGIPPFQKRQQRAQMCLLQLEFWIPLVPEGLCLERTVGCLVGTHVLVALQWHRSKHKRESSTCEPLRAFTDPRFWRTIGTPTPGG